MVTERKEAEMKVYGFAFVQLYRVPAPVACGLATVVCSEDRCMTLSLRTRRSVSRPSAKSRARSRARIGWAAIHVWGWALQRLPQSHIDVDPYTYTTTMAVAGRELPHPRQVAQTWCRFVCWNRLLPGVRAVDFRPLHLRRGPESSLPMCYDADAVKGKGRYEVTI